MAFLIRLIISAIAIWVTAQIIPGIELEGLEATVIAALLFGIVNALIRPILLVASCLINVLTLGLFTFVINALMLLLTSWLYQQLNLPGVFHVEGFIAALLGSIVISIISAILSGLVRD